MKNPLVLAVLSILLIAARPMTPELQDPTWDEMIYFINHDHTNWNEYVIEADGHYVCRHFACDVCLAARDQGIRCAFVHISFHESGHAIVAFETTDRGLVYFEPQFDKRMKVELGRKYWSWMYLPGRLQEYIDRIDYDDTIIAIQPYWNTDPGFCEN